MTLTGDIKCPTGEAMAHVQSQAVSMVSHRSEIGTTGIAKAGVSDTPGKLSATMVEKAR